MIEAHWGESPPLSLGVEEELMLVDAETLEQRPAVRPLLAELEPLDGRFKTELFAAVVEVNTTVCGSALQALDEVAALRRAAARAGDRLGLRIAAAATHPRSVVTAQEIVDDPRYREMVEYAGPSARRQGVNGLHVHVGMPSGDDCLRALEGVLPWLPVVLALSANSPYFEGAESGFASARAPVLAELPRSGAPPYFPSYRDWERHVERLARLRLPADYTALWWDVRPHPRFGTLELRMPDQPTAVQRTGGFVALLQALCALALDAPARPPDLASRAVYQQNRWAAARFGLRAELIDPACERVAPASELARELLARVEPHAHALGTADLLAALDFDRSESDRQLEVGRAHGLEAVCRDVAERSLPSP
ncbi:MAG: YbdK family carboxylate-amine ligase [Thermoleophilia bacterium]|nr:YbdK family carboxylate-amine ligase [Thermoleophilia bacterium]